MSEAYVAALVVQFMLAESHRYVLCIPMLPHQEPYDRLAGHFHNARTAPAARIMTEGFFGCPQNVRLLYDM